MRRDKLVNYVPPYMNYAKPGEAFDGNFDGNGYNGDFYKTDMGCTDYKCCNQVEESCQFVDVPHYINYHTHNIMNVYKRHFTVPTCSQSSEVRVFDVEVPYQAGYNGNGLNNFFVPFR